MKKGKKRNKEIPNNSKQRAEQNSRGGGRYFQSLGNVNMRKPSTRRPGQARIAQWLRRNIQLYWRCISSRSSLLLLAIEMKMMRSMILEPMEESKFLSLIAFVCALIGRSPNVPIPRKRRKKKAKLVLLLLEIPRMRIEDDKRRTYVRIQYLVVDDTSG